MGDAKFDLDLRSRSYTAASHFSSLAVAPYWSKIDINYASAQRAGGIYVFVLSVRLSVRLSVLTFLSAAISNEPLEGLS